MSKMRTKKSAAKRFKVTGTGKVQRRQTRQNHLLSKKTSTKKRALSGERTVAAAEARKVRRLLGKG